MKALRAVRRALAPCPSCCSTVFLGLILEPLGLTLGLLGLTFDSLGATLGSPWVHFGVQKRLRAPTMPQEPPKRRHHVFPLPLLETFFDPKSLQTRSKMGVKRDAKNHNEKNRVSKAFWDDCSSPNLEKVAKNVVLSLKIESTTCPLQNRFFLKKGLILDRF